MDELLTANSEASVGSGSPTTPDLVMVGQTPWVAWVGSDGQVNLWTQDAASLPNPVSGPGQTTSLPPSITTFQVDSTPYLAVAWTTTAGGVMVATYSLNGNQPTVAMSPQQVGSGAGPGPSITVLEPVDASEWQCGAIGAPPGPQVVLAYRANTGIDTDTGQICVLSAPATSGTLQFSSSTAVNGAAGSAPVLAVVGPTVFLAWTYDGPACQQGGTTLQPGMIQVLCSQWPLGFAQPDDLWYGSDTPPVSATVDTPPALTAFGHDLVVTVDTASGEVDSYLCWWDPDPRFGSRPKSYALPQGVRGPTSVSVGAGAGAGAGMVLTEAASGPQSPTAYHAAFRGLDGTISVESGPM